MSLSPAHVTTVDGSTVRSWLADRDDLVILDVRSAAEFESMHIRGSYNVPLPLLAEHADELATRLDAHVVLVCQSGMRAEQARLRLVSAGIDSAVVLEGGTSGFASAGGDVVRGRGRWDLERQVRFTAGSLVVASLLGGRFLNPALRGLAGLIGTGLSVSAATNTCVMGQALAAMPWNRASDELTISTVIRSLPAPTAEETDAA